MELTPLSSFKEICINYHPDGLNKQSLSRLIEMIKQVAHKNGFTGNFTINSNISFDDYKKLPNEPFKHNLFIAPSQKCNRPGGKRLKGPYTLEITTPDNEYFKARQNKTIIIATDGATGVIAEHYWTFNYDNWGAIRKALPPSPPSDSCLSIFWHLILKIKAFFSYFFSNAP